MTTSNRRTMIIGVAATSVLLITGCAKPSTDAEVLAQSAASQAEAAKRLSESAERAVQAQEELARIQTARTRPSPMPVRENLDGVPEELRRPVTIEWSGPAPEAARRVAEIVGWEYHVVGNAPATVANVNISMRERPAVKALEDIGLQAQPFGQIVADPSHRRIEFRYVNTSRVNMGSRASMTK